MRVINTQKGYQAVTARNAEFLQTVGNETPTSGKDGIESDVVADYEEQQMPVFHRTLPEAINLRMHEMRLNQLKLPELLNISPSRVRIPFRQKRTQVENNL